MTEKRTKRREKAKRESVKRRIRDLALDLAMVSGVCFSSAIFVSESSSEFKCLFW